MNKLDTAKRAQVLSALVEGNSIRATVRMTGVAKNTIQKLLLAVGAACDEYQSKVMTNLPCRAVQCDELWGFVYQKQKNVPEERRGVLGFGDVWLWIATDADTKLIPTWLLGHRDADHANAFMFDLAKRMANRIQLTTDGFQPYRWAVGQAFKGKIDYAMLVKQYGTEKAEAGRYSPPVCIGAVCKPMRGNSDPEEISTSYSERQNLTVRMGMRRFTRLTNAFSKKLENLAAAVALHYMWYNFGRVHMTIKTTPAIKAGVTGHKWTLEDIARLAD